MALKLTLTGLAAAVVLLLPLAVDGQQGTRTYRVGVLWHAANREGEGPIFEGFIDGLRERGYVEGRNIVLEHRFAAEMPERFRSMAAELVALKPDLLVGVSPPSAVALKSTGTSIPIVFTVVADAVAAGLVQGYTRQSGNITGFTILTPDLIAKRLQLLLEILPSVKRVGVLYNPDSPLKQRILREVAAAAETLALTTQLAEVRNADDIDGSFAQFAKGGIKAVLITPDPLLWLERKRIARAAIAAGIAETQFSREGAEEGSLFSYGPNLPAVARQTSDYIVRILLGTPARDLPVVQPTRFELVVNLKTAKALGLKIPQSLLLRADQVIE
jgi:putative ABC transport system substrate-binding protein